MGLRHLVIRWVATVLLAVWFGGFTFYSSFVLPVLHAEMGKFDTGAVVTRQVTARLNQVGAATLAAWWVLVAAERPAGTRQARLCRVGLLAADTLILIGLFTLHAAMSRRLDASPVRGFYPLHRVYLWASTMQWVVNLALVAVTLRVWSPSASDSPPSRN
jgi:hypothetical protein